MIFCRALRSSGGVSYITYLVLKKEKKGTHFFRLVLRRWLENEQLRPPVQWVTLAVGFVFLIFLF